MYACNGILFNHESPLRGETFVTRKITRGLARIVLNRQDCIYLGNLDARRDWGHARDYVDMQWRMLQQDKPEDFVIATGEQHSVRDFVNAAASELGIMLEWNGKELEEVATVSDPGPHTGLKRGQVIVRVDPRYFRPLDVDSMLGDARKAREKLGWVPKVSFKQLVSEMVQADLDAASKEQLLQQHDHSPLLHGE
jgi:GDPmannose 4,6-dehydratase